MLSADSVAREPQAHGASDGHHLPLQKVCRARVQDSQSVLCSLPRPGSYFYLYQYLNELWQCPPRDQILHLQNGNGDSCLMCL